MLLHRPTVVLHAGCQSPSRRGGPVNQKALWAQAVCLANRVRPSLSFLHMDGRWTLGKAVLASWGKVPRVWASSPLTH